MIEEVPEATRHLAVHFGAQGVTEVVYQPPGPDVARELATFAEAVAG